MYSFRTRFKIFSLDDVDKSASDFSFQTLVGKTYEIKLNFSLNMWAKVFHLVSSEMFSTRRDGSFQGKFLAENHIFPLIWSYNISNGVVIYSVSMTRGSFQFHLFFFEKVCFWFRANLVWLVLAIFFSAFQVEQLKGGSSPKETKIWNVTENFPAGVFKTVLIVSLGFFSGSRSLFKRNFSREQISFGFCCLKFMLCAGRKVLN